MPHHGLDGEMASDANNGGNDDREADAAFRTALEQFTQKCSGQYLEKFEGGSSYKVKCELIRIQRDQERLKAMLGLRRVQEFILRIEELHTVLKAFLNGDYYISYVWGAMQFLFSVRDIFATSFVWFGRKDAHIGGRSRLAPSMKALTASWLHTKD
jgi:hypothetical protein